MKFQIAVFSTILFFILSCSKDSSQKSIGTVTEEGKPSNDTSEENQSGTISSPATPWTFKLFSASDPEVGKAQVGIGCGCGPTLANNPAATTGCTIYLITEGGTILPSAEVGAVVPFREGTSTCGAQECSKLTEKFAHTTACVPFYGFFDKVDEKSLRLRPDSVSDSASSQPALGLSALPVEAKDTPVSCGSKGQFSSLQQCLAKQGECMSSGWFYVTGCNYSCDGGGGAVACPRPDTVNINSTPDAFNYGLLSTSGQLGWAVGGEVVQLGKNIGEGFLLLGKSGADCVTGGYAFGSDSVFMPCLTTALVAGAIVVTVYVPAAAPYIGYAGTGLATGMAGWNAYRCVAPSNLTMEQSLEYCRKASADLATAIPVGQIAGLAKKLSKTAAARKFDAEATCVTNGYQTKRSREGNPVIGDEVLQTELRGKEIVQLQRSGSAKDVTDAANKLDDMGKFFAVTNTEQKLMPLTGGKAHEMHIALSLIRNSATTEELAFLMGGINAGKRELLTKLASKLYGPITETDEIAKNLVKNAEVYFTAAQKVKGYFYRYKQIPQGDIPTICTEMNTIQAQKIADKYMPSGFTNSTGRRMGGKGGVGMFKWEDGGDTVPVIFQINATKGGVLGVVATGESTIMQLAKLKFGDRAILNEAILMLPKPTATGVRKRVIDMPDGAGGFKPESVMIIELEYQTDSLVPKVISVVAQVGGSIKDFFDEPPPLDTCEACSEEEIPPSECGTATWTCIPDIVNPAANPPMWHATSWCATPSGKNCGSPSMENSACTHVLKGPFDDGNGVFLRWWSGDWESANKVVGDTYVAPCVEMP